MSSYEMRKHLSPLRWNTIGQRLSDEGVVCCLGQRCKADVREQIYWFCFCCLYFILQEIILYFFS